MSPKADAMRRVHIDNTEIVRLAILQEFARSEESRYQHRLHGLLLVIAGKSCREAGRLLGEEGTTVQRWVRRLNAGGVEALRDGERGGRPRTLGARDWRRLQADLRKSPLHFGFAAGRWGGAILSVHLRRRFSVEIGVRQCQRLLRRLDSHE
jgi:transposase